MRRLLALATVALCCRPRAEAPTPNEPLTVYIASAGSDSSSGSRDEPFATLTRARDFIRELKRSHGLPDGGVRVVIADGLYEHIVPFELLPEDSGTSRSPIVYAAAPSALPRLAGGVELKTQHAVRSADVSGLLGAAVHHVREIDVAAIMPRDNRAIEVAANGEPLMLARWPNDGYAKTGRLVGGESIDVRGVKGRAASAFEFRDVRMDRWANEKQLRLHGFWFWDWADEELSVASLDSANRTVQLAPPLHEYGLREGQRFYAVGILAELDAPGEWYVDRAKGVLYVWPRSTADQLVMSTADSVVRIMGASHVRFEGLTFETSRAAAVHVENGAWIELAGCTIRGAGGWGIEIHGGHAASVHDNEIKASGRGGILVRGGDRTLLAKAEHSIFENEIHHYGRTHHTGYAGIELAGVGIHVANNAIHHAPHEGIRFNGNDHIIERNEIYHVCTETDDAGAIYAGRDWTMRGTLIRENYIHDVIGRDGRRCNGVFLDDMFSGVMIERNIFQRVTGAVLIGGGRDNVVDNNIFVDCPHALHMDSRGMGWAAPAVKGVLTERLRQMPVESSTWRLRYPKLSTILESKPEEPSGNRFTHNIVWRSTLDEIDDESRALTEFTNNLVDRDPLFAPSAAEQFVLDEASPALALGFRPISLGVIGLGSKVQKTN